MVLVDAGALVFCIDATEVTNAAYDAFLAATDGGSPSALDAGAPDGCAGNVTFARFGAGVDPPTFPAARIDWCDAYAFCRWAGKRLCGKTVQGDAATGEWFAACSKAGTRRFPYGDAYDASACNDNASVATKAVGSSPGCEGGVAGLVDMNGNVAELIDDCGPAGCSAMGGYYFAPAVPAAGCAASTVYTKATVDPGLGFRCCGDPR
jgi:formylglycine-generating enzyme required for sulfatase activity